MAAGGPGSWSSHTIDDAGDSGRYSSLVLMADGTPAVSYLRMIEDPDLPGVIRSSALVAIANNTNPSGPTDWTLTEVGTSFETRMPPAQFWRLYDESRSAGQQ